MSEAIIIPPLATSFLDQLHNKAIGEEPDKQAKDRQKKIDFITKHIDKVTHVNGRRVYYPIIDGENICYFLTNVRIALSELDMPLPETRTYYFPIQYAEITLTP